MMLPNRVLLADDDLEVRSGVEELLSPLGLEFLHAENGPEALSIALARHASLALMVLDIHMPGCSGLEVLSRLRIQVSQLSVPCIFYSGEAGEGLERQARDAGAFAFLRKPVQPEVLRIEVRRALDFVHGDRRSARGRAGDL
jgi:CheY-like chemotaxis protein